MAIISVDITDSLNTFRTKVNSLATNQGDVASISGGMGASNLVDAVNAAYLAATTGGNQADTILINTANTDDHQITFVPLSSNGQYVTPLVDASASGLTYNPSTGVLTAGSFSGTINGSVSNAVNATFSTYADSAAAVAVANTDAAGSFPLVFHTGAVGSAVALSSTAGIVVNASTDTLSVDGDLIAFASSDENLKENISPIVNALSKVNTLSGNTFDWIEMPEVHDNAGADIGVIAQEVEEVFPELVVTRSNGYKAVRYDKLCAVLIEAVKELSAKVDILEGKL